MSAQLLCMYRFLDLALPSVFPCLRLSEHDMKEHDSSLIHPSTSPRRLGLFQCFSTTFGNKQQGICTCDRAMSQTASVSDRNRSQLSSQFDGASYTYCTSRMCMEYIGVVHQSCFINCFPSVRIHLTLYSFAWSAAEEWNVNKCNVQ